MQRDYHQPSDFWTGIYTQRGGGGFLVFFGGLGVLGGWWGGGWWGGGRSQKSQESVGLGTCHLPVSLVLYGWVCTDSDTNTGKRDRGDKPNIPTEPKETGVPTQKPISKHRSSNNDKQQRVCVRDQHSSRARAVGDSEGPLLVYGYRGKLEKVCARAGGVAVSPRVPRRLRKVR